MQYDETAREYEARIAPKYRVIAEEVAARVELPAGGTVLELAAGTGLLTRVLAPRHRGRYVATDIAAGMLAVAADLVPATVDLVLADTHRLPLPDDAADLVVASLSPVQDTMRGVREAVRVLRPGGRLVLGCWGSGYSELALLAEVRAELGLGSYPSARTSAARRRLRDAGLVDLRREEVRLDVEHADVEDYLAYRAAFGRAPWMPPEEWAHAVSVLREHVVRRAGNGPVRLDWTVAIVSGRKETPT